ncbi:hypothetical protein NS220_15140 [Microbacterium testaceum]|uniref:Uncharacterized protein n=1 Tax=Microbacterium testaceum TaxID=2033 RepID=A0A147ETT2_MICTE|nr:hypothetical protein [Microbacterium testaceum]KTR90509.1 hypothetical protein NS220_15140 [Microbacterium testaceum]
MLVASLVVLLFAVAVVAVAVIALVRGLDVASLGRVHGRMPRRRRATWHPVAVSRPRRPVGTVSS